MTEISAEKIVSVGDAIWDIRTAHRLELPFVGGDDQRAQALRGHGASHVIENFPQRNARKIHFHILHVHPRAGLFRAERCPDSFVRLNAQNEDVWIRRILIEFLEEA